MHKEFLLFLILLFFNSNLSAQEIEAYESEHSFNFTFSSPTDTLIPGSSFTPTLYRINSTLGYVVGTNFYQDKAKAQVYQINGFSESYDLLGMMFWFGRTDTNSTAEISLNVYNTNGTGTGLNGSISAPNGVMYTEDFDVNMINPLGPNFVIFPTALPLWFDYAIGFNMENVPSTDTIALLSSLNGEGESKELSIELKENGEWKSLLGNWSNQQASFFFDVNLAMFPIIDRSTVSIEETTLFHRFQNPANGSIRIWLNEKSKTLKSIELFSIEGKHINLIRPIKGDLEIQIDTKNTAPGTYFLFFNSFEAGESYVEMIILN